MGVPALRRELVLVGVGGVPLGEEPLTAPIEGRDRLAEGSSGDANTGRWFTRWPPGAPAGDMPESEVHIRQSNLWLSLISLWPSDSTNVGQHCSGNGFT